jgi:hypothetical protein
MMIEKKYIFTETMGHGYLRVPLSDLRELGLLAAISEYSFLNGEFVELEEDYEAPMFCVLANAAGWTITKEIRQADDLPVLPRYISTASLN